MKLLLDWFVHIFSIGWQSKIMYWWIKKNCNHVQPQLAIVFEIQYINPLGNYTSKWLDKVFCSQASKYAIRKSDSYVGKFFCFF